jgi:hypothetical protein
MPDDRSRCTLPTILLPSAGLLTCCAKREAARTQPASIDENKLKAQSPSLAEKL